MSAHSTADKTTLSYLTVQDILWINFQATRKVCKFDYARLESAVYHQYGYGGSMDLPVQAARFLKAMVEKKPFTEGNAATAFVGCLTFLRLNGYDATMNDAKSWLSASTSSIHGLRERETHHEAAVADVARAVLSEFGSQLSGLD